MSIRIDCCVNIKNSLIKLVGKKGHMRCSTKCLLRFVCLNLSQLSRMAHWWEDKICKLIMQHYKSAKKRLKTHLRSLQHCCACVPAPVARATSGHSARFALLSRVPHFRLPFALPFADVDMVCVPTWFNIVLIIIISRFYDVLTLDTNSYDHLQVLIPNNLEDNHWVVA